MAFIYQNSCRVDAGTNIEEASWAAVAITEQTNPSKSYHVQLIHSDAIHSESTALRAAATHAVNLNRAQYRTDRLYVAFSAQCSASKKRKAGASAALPQTVLAVVGYDHTPCN